MAGKKREDVREADVTGLKYFDVRRAKTAIFSGCNSRPATVAPAGSNRSGEGGNEFAEAFDVRTALGQFDEQAGWNSSERH